MSVTINYINNMKKIVFLIMAVIYSLSTIAQQVALNDRVSIELPAGARKITRDEGMTHVGKKFNNDKMALTSIRLIRAGHLYKVDDILISLNVFDKKPKVPVTYLSDLKKGLDIITKRGDASHYTSNLKKINNNSVLITNDMQGKVGYYSFDYLNADNTQEITGTLHYHKDDLLNSIKFKD